MRTSTSCTPEQFPLREVFTHGHAGAVSRALSIPRQFIARWISGEKRSPFAAVWIIIETLRRNGNAKADYLFITLARSLGFVAYRIPNIADLDAKFAAVLVEVSDAVKSHGQGMDGWTLPEHEAMSDQLSELGEAAFACRDEHSRRAANLRVQARRAA